MRKVFRFLGGHVLPRRAYPILKGALKGTWFIHGALAGEGGGASVFVGDVEPKQTRAFEENVRPGDIFFDVGANVGYYTLLGAKLVGNGHVIAFEPSIRNLSLLHSHVEMNKVGNVKIMAFAVSNENKVQAFADGESTATGKLVDKGSNVSYVPTITLDEASSLLGVMPDALKIDVEGSEVDVLIGGMGVLTEKRPVIFLSTHSDDLRSECVNLLTSIGYDVEGLEGEEGYEFLAVSAV